MYGFTKKSPALGIEITSSSLRMVSTSGDGVNADIHFTGKSELPPGVLAEAYSGANICDTIKLGDVLQECLNASSSGRGRRAGLCLPDGVFRVQTLDFDELPRNANDREQLIRWRLEKAAAFDLSDGILRHQILRRQDAGFTVLVCTARKQLVFGLETMLAGLGIEPRSIGLSSFSALNFYAPYMTKKSKAFAFTHVTEDSFATIVSENGGARFYRFKDIRRGSPDEIRSRLVREIEESLHFYTHMDRSQQAEVGHLYLSGEPAVLDTFAGQLSDITALDVDVLFPGIVLPAAAGTGAEMAPALGAGRAA